MNRSYPADADPKDYQPTPARKAGKPSPSLSMAGPQKGGIKTQKVAILAADGVDDASLNEMVSALAAQGAAAKVVAPRLGFLKTGKGARVKIDFSLLTASSVLFDGVYVPDGAPSAAALKAEPDAVHFVNEAFKHCKSIAAVGEGVGLIADSAIAVEGADAKVRAEEGVVLEAGGRTAKAATEFIKALHKGRHWSREAVPTVPA